MEDGVIFFVYDNTRLRGDDSDFIGDAILYYTPKTHSESVRCTLCGHIVAINHFFKSFTGDSSGLSVASLQNMKISVQQVENYTLGLSGDISYSDESVRQRLKFLVDLFLFYHGSFTLFSRVCEETGRDFCEELATVWDRYISYVQGNGVTHRNGFGCRSTLNISREVDRRISELCSRYLDERSHSVRGLRGGCVLYKNRVAFSQLTADLTARVCILRPREQKVLAWPADNTQYTESVSEGLSIYKAYLTPVEHKLQTGSTTENLLTEKVSDIDGKVSNSEELSRKSQPDPEDNESVEGTGSSRIHTGAESQEGIDPVEGTRSSVTCPGSESHGGMEQVEMDLYVQSCSDMVVVLLLDKGTSSSQDLITELWRESLLHMAEVESNVKRFPESSGRSATLLQRSFSHTASHEGRRYKYLAYDETEGTLTGDVLEPNKGEELEFYSTSLLMNDRFLTSPQVTETFLRKGGSVYGGVRLADHQLFCYRPHSGDQSKGPAFTTPVVGKMKNLLQSVISGTVQ